MGERASGRKQGRRSSALGASIRRFALSLLAPSSSTDTEY